MSFKQLNKDQIEEVKKAVMQMAPCDMLGMATFATTCFTIAVKAGIEMPGPDPERATCIKAMKEFVRAYEAWRKIQRDKY